MSPPSLDIPILEDHTHYAYCTTTGTVYIHYPYNLSSRLSATTINTLYLQHLLHSQLQASVFATSATQLVPLHRYNYNIVPFAWYYYVRRLQYEQNGGAARWTGFCSGSLDHLSIYIYRERATYYVQVLS